MSEEERKAIELLETYKNKLVYEISNKDKRAVETVLNLIEKQQKEIEKNKNFIDFLQLNDVKKLGKIIKKDKIIDLMAEYINELDIDEDICSKNIINSDICNEQYSNCKACIKQYFERKGEEDK